MSDADTPVIGQIGRAVACYLLEIEYGYNTPDMEQHLLDAIRGALVPIHIGKTRETVFVYRDPEFDNWFLRRN